MRDRSSCTTRSTQHRRAAASARQRKKSVKWPIDFVVSTLRLLRDQAEGHKDTSTAADDSDRCARTLDDMGQTLFEPPSVFGWDWESGWISSATMLARYGFARDVDAPRAKGGVSGSTPRSSSTSRLHRPTTIVDAVTGRARAHRSVHGRGSRTALIAYLTDDGTRRDASTSPTTTFATRKLHGLFALVLQSPAYQLH